MCRRYSFPPEKIFDEVYFARAAEEYLKRQYIYESTHPPLSKLLITFSTILFGGLHGGDNSAGWRFLGVLAGAATVWFVYALAKRVTGSSFYAAYASLLLTADGMHFVQSRIATPESFVALFSLATVYTFYRFWLSVQTRAGVLLVGRGQRVRGIGIATCCCLTALLILLRFSRESAATKCVGMLYAFACIYFLYRAFIEPIILRNSGTFRSYPEGSTDIQRSNQRTLNLPDGGQINNQSPRVLPGDSSRGFRGSLVLQDEDLKVNYRKDHTVEYTTPVAVARYAPEVTLVEGKVHAVGDSRFWLMMFAGSLAALVTSKWYGVMFCGVATFIVIGVWSQPRVALLARKFFNASRTTSRWGNPHGFQLDLVLAAVIAVTGTIYFGSYVPQFIGLSDTPNAAPRPYSFTDIVNLQQSMYQYHAHLTQTHPYASKWWQWPLDLRPILYYSSWGKDQKGNLITAQVILSLPNPLILWFGLLAVLSSVCWDIGKETRATRYLS